jgi:hypothetical protein
MSNGPRKATGIDAVTVRDSLTRRGRLSLKDFDAPGKSLDLFEAHA